MPRAAISSRLATREPSGTPTRFAFPKSDTARAALPRRQQVLAGRYVVTRILESARILRTSDFRKAYKQGTRIAGQYFTAFCLRTPREDGQGPRLGFTIPRAFGKAVLRNRAKRRLREIFRVRLLEFSPEWDIVINPRRAALTASPEELRREVDRLITRCGKQ
ncbi:MAG: ribonuclease P protein component [Acidobacteriia bacterium]|nr:ribonuclease P protein component [Terriglobia bacterium]